MEAGFNLGIDFASFEDSSRSDFVFCFFFERSRIGVVVKCRSAVRREDRKAQKNERLPLTVHDCIPGRPGDKSNGRCWMAQSSKGVQRKKSIGQSSLARHPEIHFFLEAQMVGTFSFIYLIRAT